MMRIILVSLVFLIAVGCRQDAAVFLTLSGVPASARSVAVRADLEETPSNAPLPGVALPMPASERVSMVLAVQSGLHGTLRLAAATFSGDGATGCLLTTGSLVLDYEGGDRDLTLDLMPVSDTVCAGNVLSTLGTTPNLGAVSGGAEITVQGWGFYPEAKVLFDGEPSPAVSYVSATTLKATVPVRTSGYAKVPVTVINPDGNQGTSRTPFSYFSERILLSLLPSSIVYRSSSVHIAKHFSAQALAGILQLDLSTNRLKVTAYNGLSVSFEDTYPLGSAPLALAIGDFDQDGYDDAAVLDATDTTIRVFLNNRQGKFVQGSSIPTTLPGTGLWAADLDGNGVTDLLTAHHNDQAISIYLSNGRGGFAAGLQRSTAPQVFPTALAVADLDLNGHADIIIANDASAEFGIFYNPGGGQFSGVNQTLAAGVSRSIHVSAARLFSDATTTLLFVPPSGLNYVGALSFEKGKPGLPLTIPTDMGPLLVETADLNGDDRPEIVVLCQSGPQLNVFRNDGIGDFPFGIGAPDMPLHFPLSQGRTDLAIGNLSGDGHPDLVVAGTTGPDLLIAD